MIERWTRLEARELPAFNEKLSKAGLPALSDLEAAGAALPPRARSENEE
jgi:hypothetical protein